MMDFVLAALPFVCVGIAVALLAVKHGVVVTVKNDDGTELRRRGTESTYMTEGMCLAISIRFMRCATSSGVARLVSPSP